MWAVRVPPLVPADEPQHYLYAATFDGTEPTTEPGERDVPRDLQALAELVQLGPHTTKRQTIDLSPDRQSEIDRLRAETDDPANAAVVVPDSLDNKIISHKNFQNYHPPLYYSIAGQCLRVGHALGLGIRGRMLIGRLFSIMLALVTAWLTVLVGRRVWPGRWGLPVAVALATGWQLTVAYYTSAITNDAMTYLLVTLFLVLGAGIITRGPSLRFGLGLVVTAGLALMTKITMLMLAPVGLAAFALGHKARKSRALAITAMGLFFAAGTAWLVVPMSGGESVVTQYMDLDTEPRSFPIEMFKLSRLMEHLKIPTQLWGRKLGHDVPTDVQMPTLAYAGLTALGLAASISAALLLLRPANRPRRRLILWLALAPLMTFALFYAIDYRFASIGGGRFIMRSQYYVPVAAAMMLLVVWSLTGWLRGRAVTAVATGFVALLGVYNLWVLVAVLCPRYYGPATWWGRYEQIATLWPVPPWSIALCDALALVSTIAAVAVVGFRIDRD